MTGHRAKKRFGQHFLRDRRVVDRIIRVFDPRPTDTVVEIGPGQGVLTHELVGRVGRLHAIELDRDLVAHLRQRFSPDALSLHGVDALRFEFGTLVPPGTKLRVIGNLPYNISTPLLFHLLEQIDVVHDMLFMLQKEVVERLAAQPGGKDYGRLSVMIQWRLRVEKLFDVGPSAFSPPPRVDSSVVRLAPHATPPIEVTDPAHFSRIVQAAFAQRRKTLRNNLKGMVDAAEMQRIDIDPNRRAETLTLEEFARLARCAPATGVR
jgi:16S rRNA (adenine1518-N6/adenine1519-N6)-dimethyltransferase